MNRKRLILFAAFGVFHLFLVFFSFYVDAKKEHDLSFLLKLVPWITFLKWATVLGLLMFFTDFVWSYLHARGASNEKAAHEHEMNTLKAKLFDLQEAAKTKATHPANPNVKP